MKYLSLLALGIVSVCGALWTTTSAYAHPIDMTSVEFFVVEDWEGNQLAEQTMRGVHTLNWLEALALIDESYSAADILADFSVHEPQLFTYLRENLRVQNNGSECALINLSLPTQTRDEVVISGLYLLFDVTCSEPLSVLDVDATFLIDKFPNQSNYVGVYQTPTELIADTTLTPDTTSWSVFVPVAAASTTTDPALPTLATSDQTYAEKVMGWLPSLLDNANPLTIVLVLGAVFLIGLLHTLEAGHSKVILASLMLEKRVDFKKGVWYVVVFTLTHVADIIIIGLALLALSSFYETASLFTEIERVAYVLLFGMGVYLLFKALGNIAKTRLHLRQHHHEHTHSHHHEHNHDHQHDHDHHHDHTPQGATLKEQLTIAFLTGLAPCLMGWSVLLLILASGQVWLILPAIGVFGLGIGAGLFLVMLTTIFLKDRVHRRFRSIGLYAPVLSALVLIFTALWLLT